MPPVPEECRICAVVVARNEEATVAICLAAARRALDAVGGGEILLVDSLSTDRTAAIGLEFGCRVLAVRSASRVCPSAMRYLGVARTRSRYILFLDGDCELEPDFLRAALKCLETEESLGVVAGRRRDFYRTSQGLVPAQQEYYAGPSGRGSPPRPGYGGCALYRRKALEEAGSFDPFLRAKEEHDLALRIQAAGYRIRILPISMIRHMTVPRESARRLLRSLNHGFYVGRGQAMRKFLSRGEIGAAFQNLGKVFLVAGNLGVGVGCAAAWLEEVHWPLAAWSGLSLIAFGVFALRAGGISRAGYYLTEWLVQGVCLGVGFLTPRRPAGSFRWRGEELSLSGGGERAVPKVLLVGPLPPPPLRGGVEKGVDLLLRGSLARRAAMRLFNTFRPMDPDRPLLERLKYQAGMLRGFRRCLKEQSVDLVHVKTSSGINFFQSSLYALAARFSGIPVLLQIHSGRFEAFYLASSAPRRAWIRYTLSRACRVAVLSQSWAARVRGLVPTAEVRVVPNGLACDEFARLSSGGCPKAGQVLFLGAGREDLDRDKGLEDLLAVLPELWREHAQSRWVLAGLANPESTYEGLKRTGVDPEGSGPRVRCLGVVDLPTKERLLKESSILALPSYFENMPNLVLEAMAAGLSMAATDRGAIPEMLGIEGGILFSPGDRPALAAALGRLLVSPSLVEEQGRRNRETVSRNYTMDVVESNLQNLYREIEEGTTKSPEAVTESAKSASTEVTPPAAPEKGHRVARP